MTGLVGMIGGPSVAVGKLMPQDFRDGYPRLHRHNDVASAFDDRHEASDDGPNGICGGSNAAPRLGVDPMDHADDDLLSWHMVEASWWYA